MVSLNPYVLTTTAGEGLWGEGWEERGAGDSQGISECHLSAVLLLGPGRHCLGSKHPGIVGSGDPCTSKKPQFTFDFDLHPGRGLPTPPTLLPPQVKQPPHELSP